MKEASYVKSNQSRLHTVPRICIENPEDSENSDADSQVRMVLNSSARHDDDSYHTSHGDEEEGDFEIYEEIVGQQTNSRTLTADGKKEKKRTKSSSNEIPKYIDWSNPKMTSIIFTEVEANDPFMPTSNEDKSTAWSVVLQNSNKALKTSYPLLQEDLFKESAKDKVSKILAKRDKDRKALLSGIGTDAPADISEDQKKLNTTLDKILDVRKSKTNLSTAQRNKIVERKKIGNCRTSSRIKF
jgi:hypothetical protein